MNISYLLNILESFTSSSILKLSIESSIFKNEEGRKQYNKLIRENVQDEFGVYMWCNTQTEEIYYIGMAGKVNTNGTLGNHSLQKRLTAFRGRDKVTKKDIQTNDFVNNFMKSNKINLLDFYVIYLKEGIPPAYIEAVLLFEFYKVKNCLPKLNNSF